MLDIRGHTWKMDFRQSRHYTSSCLKPLFPSFRRGEMPWVCAQGDSEGRIDGGGWEWAERGLLEVLGSCNPRTAVVASGLRSPVGNVKDGRWNPNTKHKACGKEERWWSQTVKPFIWPVQHVFYEHSLGRVREMSTSSMGFAANNGTYVCRMHLVKINWEKYIDPKYMVLVASKQFHEACNHRASYIIWYCIMYMHVSILSYFI